MAVDKELVAYKVDSNNSLQYSQGHRLLPYLATGSAGLLLLINRNKEILSSKYLKYLTSLERATDVVFVYYQVYLTDFVVLKLLIIYIVISMITFQDKRN